MNALILLTLLTVETASIQPWVKSEPQIVFFRGDIVYFVEDANLTRDKYLGRRVPKGTRARVAEVRPPWVGMYIDGWGGWVHEDKLRKSK